MAEYDKASFLSGLASALGVKPLRASNHKTDATNYGDEPSTDRDKTLNIQLNTLSANSNDSAAPSLEQNSQLE